MQIIGVIPARYGSTRLKAKPLISIAGRPLLEWVILGARQARSLSAIYVATDHPEIADLAKKLNVQVVMTPPECPSGSDRVWAAARSLPADVVVNIQGDEALLKGVWIDSLTQPFFADPHLKMATLSHSLKADEVESLSSVKVITDKNSNAIYFSRWAIPYSRLTYKDEPTLAMKHIGLYAYKKEFLSQFCSTPGTSLERAESLEQLRALYMGEKIKVIPIDAESIGVDTADDVVAVEMRLNKK